MVQSEVQLWDLNIVSKYSKWPPASYIQDKIN